MTGSEFPSCDIVTADCAVTCFDMSISSVNEVIAGGDRTHSYNTSFFSLRPSELEDKELVRWKMRTALARIEAGEYDYIFTSNMNIMTDHHTNLSIPPEEYKSYVIKCFKDDIENDETIDRIIENSKVHIAAARKNLGPQPTEEQLDQVAEYIRKHSAIMPEHLDRFIRRQRMPIILLPKGQRIQSKGGALIPVTTDILGKDIGTATVQALGILKRPLYYATTMPSLEADNDTLKNLVQDYGKVHYNVTRKRDEIQSYNAVQRRDPSQVIPLAPSQEERKNADSNTVFDAIGTLSEINFVLNYSADSEKQAIIRTKFDRAMAFDEAAMGYIKKQIDTWFPPELDAPALPKPQPVIAKQESPILKKTMDETELPKRLIETEITLKGATAEQQQEFNVAYAMIPELGKQQIRKLKATFSIDASAVATRIKDGHVTLSPKDIPIGPNNQSYYLYASALVATVQPTIDNGLLRDALIEYSKYEAENPETHGKVNAKGIRKALEKYGRNYTLMWLLANGHRESASLSDDSLCKQIVEKYEKAVQGKVGLAKVLDDYEQLATQKEEAAAAKITLQGATQQQQRNFDAAYELLPAHLRKQVEARGLTFGMNPRSTVATIKFGDKHIIMASAYVNRPKLLQRQLYLGTLVELFEPTIDESLFEEALKEYVTRVVKAPSLLNMGQRTTASEHEEMMRSYDRKSAITNLLEEAHKHRVTAPDDSPGNRILHLYESASHEAAAKLEAAESAITLRGGSEKQQQDFKEAYDGMPDYIKQLIDIHKLNFSLGAASEMVKSGDKDIVIPMMTFRESRFISSHLFSRVLIATVQPSINDALCQKAYKEHSERLSRLGQSSAYADMNRMEPSRAMGHILEGAHRQSNRLSNESPSIQVMHLYEAAALEQVALAKVQQEKTGTAGMVLDNALPKQQQKFTVAFDLLPDYLKRLVQTQEVTFSAGNADEPMSFHNKHVTFSLPSLTRKNFPNTVLAASLVSTVNPNVNQSLYEAALREYADRQVSNPEVQDLANAKDVIKQANKHGRKYVLMHILADIAKYQTALPSDSPGKQLMQIYELAAKEEARKLPEVGTRKPPELKIIQHPQYGGGTKDAIDIFRKETEGWEDWVKELIAAHNITFVMQKERSMKGQSVYDLEKREVVVDATRIRQALTRTEFQAMPMFCALFCAMQDHMPKNIDWQSARREVLSSSKINHFDTKDHRISDVTVLTAIRKTLLVGEAEQARNTWPHALGIYEKFMDAVKAEATKTIEATQPVRPTIKLHGATTEEQNKFDNAFARLPDYAKEVILHSGGKFVVDRASQLNSVKNGDILLSHTVFRSPHYLEGQIFGLGLVCGAKHKIDEPLLQQALREYSRMATKKGEPKPSSAIDKLNTPLSVITEPEVRRRMMEKGKECALAGIIGGVYESNGGEVDADVGDGSNACVAIYNSYANVARKLADEISQTTMGKTRITLAGATGEQQQKFDDAFALLPVEIKTAIQGKNIKFSITKPDPRGSQLKVSNGTVFLEDRQLEYTPVQLSSYLFGGGLDAAFQVPVDATLLHAAIHENIDRSFLSMDTTIPIIKNAIGISKSPQGISMRYGKEGRGAIAEILAGVHVDARAEDPSEFQHLLKARTEIHDRYLAAARQYAEEVLPPDLLPTVATQKAWAEKYQASERAFAINAENGALTPPQQEYFTKLNEVISILGVSPKAFDDQFKFSAAHAAHICAANQTIKEMKSVSRASIDKTKEFSTIQKKLEYGTLPKAVMGITYKTGNANRKRMERLYAQPKEEGAEHFIKIVGLVMAMFECVKLPLPENADEHEKAVRGGIAFEKGSLVLSSPDGREVPFEIKGDIILQRIASGTYKLETLDKIHRDYSTLVADYRTPSCGDFARVSVANAALRIAANKGIMDEPYRQLTEKLKEMEALWPQVVMSHGQYQSFQAQEAAAQTRRQEIETQRARTEAQETERRQRLEAEEAKPKPYTHTLEFPKKNQSAAVPEIQKLCQSLNSKDAAQQKIGDALFKGAVGNLLIAAATGIGGKINSALIDSPEKNKGITAAREKALLLLRGVLESDDPALIPLKQELMDSPVIFAALCGNRNAVLQALELTDADLKQLFIEEQLSPPAIIEPVGQATVADTEATESERPAEQEDIAADNAAAQDAAPESSSRLPVVPEVDAEPLPLASILQNDPALKPEELNKRRGQAYEAMTDALAADAFIAALAAVNDGYNQFRCDLLVDKTHARIRLLFKSDREGVLPRETMIDLNSNQYPGGYARLGVVPTSLDALNLQIIVNAAIAGEGDFQPILGKTSTGKPRITKNDFIPNRAVIRGERETKLDTDNAGIYRLRLTGKYYAKSKDQVTVVFPLGVKKDDDAALEIANERAAIIVKYIDDLNPPGAKHRKVPFKGEIQEHLEYTVAELFEIDPQDPHSQWVSPTPERIELLVTDRLKPAYLESIDPVYRTLLELNDSHDRDSALEAAENAIPRVIAVDKEDDWGNWKEALTAIGEQQYRKTPIPLPSLDVYDATTNPNPQVTTLGAMALTKDGNNGTYQVALFLNVNDNPMADSTAGPTIRTRKLNLCIEDADIARARAQEVVFGSARSMGFAYMIENYFEQRPQARWPLAQKNETEKAKVLVENLETGVADIIGKDALTDYRRMIKNELPITNINRRLNIVCEEPQGGNVVIRVEIQEKQPDGQFSSVQNVRELAFEVPEKQADMVESFARGDMDGVRLDRYIHDLIPRFEHDLSVKMHQGNAQNRKIPVTFSVMRGKLDGKLEPHLDNDGKPVTVTKLIPEIYRDKIPEYERIVSESLSMLAGLHYSPIKPQTTFNGSGHAALQQQFARAKTGDGFIDQRHPKFDVDKPINWLANAMNSDLEYIFGRNHNIETLQEPGKKGGGTLSKGPRERFPRDIISEMRSVEPFADRLDDKTGFKRGV